MLTKKQKNLLIYINNKIRSTGVSPSYEEMKDSLNLKSKSGIHRLISALEERGFVRRLAHKARALEVVKLPENASANDIFNTFTPSVIKGGLDNTPNTASEISILGSIAAGTPIEAIQQEVDRVALPENLQNSGEHYGLKVKGDSMIEAGQFVQTIEKRQGLKVACLEEIGFQQDWITRDQLLLQAEKFAKTGYGQYLKKIAGGYL